MVFSTYVEVIPHWLKTNFIDNRILHVCGGDPNIDADYKMASQYSPRMWR